MADFDEINKLMFEEYTKSQFNSSNQLNELYKAYGLSVDLGDDSDETFNIYEKQEQALNDIHTKELKHQKEMNDWMIKNNIYKQQAEAAYDKTVLENLKKQYTYQTTNADKKYSELNKREAEIYKNAIARGRELNKEELKNLKQIEKERIFTEERVREEQEKSTKLMSTRIKEVAKTTITHVMKDVNAYIDFMYTDNIKSGITNLKNAYETNFTPIAGYSGSDSRQNNHDFIKSVLTEVNANDYTKNGLNFNSEVFPQITQAVKEGFMGSEAKDVAITNAIDKKIMPWLETSSESWVQLQYNLTDERLQSIKSQQLLLQETREGNRLLQSGVISQLTESLVPTLQSIDANGTNEESMGAAYEFVEKLIAGGMSKTDAVSYVKKLIKAEQDTYGALTSSDPILNLMAWGAYQNPDNQTVGAQEMVSNTLGVMLASSGSGMTGEITRSALAHIWNVPLPSDDEYYKNLFNMTYEKKYSDPTKYENLYSQKMQNLPENVTATQSHDNWWQNHTAGLVFDQNNKKHGMDTTELILNEVINIKNWLMGIFTELLISLSNKIINSATSKFFSGKNGSGGSNVLGNLASKALTGGKGFSGATQFGSTTLQQAASMGAKNLGYGLTQGGLVGGLSQGGSLLSGGALSGGSAFALGTAFTVGGALAAGYGIKEGVKDISDRVKNGNTMSDKEKRTSNVNILGDAAITAGGGMAAAAGLGLASGPVGWIGFTAVAVGMLGKKIYESATKIGGATAAIEEAYNQQVDSMKQTAQKNSDTLADILGNLQDNTLTENDLQVQKNKLIESGLLTDKDVEKAKGANKDQLEELTKAYLKATNKFGNDIEGEMATYQVESKNWSEEAWGNLENTMQKWNDKNGSRKRNEDWREAATIVMNQIHSSLTKQLNEGKTLDEDTQKVYDNITKYMKDGFTNSELNKIIDDGAFNTVFQNIQLEVKALGNIKNRLLAHSDDNKAAKEMFDSMNNTDSKYYDDNTTSDAITYLLNAIHATVKENAKEYLEKFKKAGYKLSDYDLDQSDTVDRLRKKWGDTLDLTQYKLGSTFIPTDMIAQLHKGERVLTENQNKEYTEMNISGNDSIIQTGVQDIVSAIQQQTSDIISYLRELSFNSSNESIPLNMSPAMGNTRVVL